MKAHLALLPGDGIGPEVTYEAVRVLESVASRYGHQFTCTEHLIGGCSIDRFGIALTDETLADCQAADAVLLGAVGGPRWDDPQAAVRPEQGLLRIRKELGVFANLRPVRVHPALASLSPLKSDKLVGVDILILRELTGGLYFGQPKGRDIVNGRQRAVDTLEYYEDEIQRIVRLAFDLAARRRNKVTSVDKANVLESSRLWRKTTMGVAANYPRIKLDHMLVDTAAMRLISSPDNFDVLVTENMFGDILTDEASVLVGSMGLLPSASLGDHGPGLYEPVHGSAPDIAGQGIANPIGAILSVAMMLRYTFKLEQEAAAVEAAVDSALSSGARSADLGGRLTTKQMTDQILQEIEVFQ